MPQAPGVAEHGICRRGSHFNGPQSLKISQLELIPIILACAAWGQHWGRTQVICHCDNQVVVTALQSRTSKAKGIMHMIRCLAFIEARLECSLRAMYVSTQDNDLADDLSRNNLSSWLTDFR